MLNLVEGAQYFDNAFLTAFNEVIAEFSKNLVFNEYDFRAVLYYYLRHHLETENKPYSINFDYTLRVSSGQYGSENIKPDIVVWNTQTEVDTVCGELKFSSSKSIAKNLLFWDYNKLKKLRNQYSFQRSYFLCIAKQPIEKLLAPLINIREWSRKGRYSIKKSKEWVFGYLCIFFYSIQEQQGFKISFPANRVQITKLK